MYFRLIVQRHDAVSNCQRSGAIRRVEIPITGVAVSDAVCPRCQGTGSECGREVATSLNHSILSHAVKGYCYAPGRNQRTETELPGQVRRRCTVGDERRAETAER